MIPWRDSAMKEIKFWSVKGKPNYVILTRFCVFLFKLSFSRARFSLGPGKQKAIAQIFSNPHL